MFSSTDVTGEHSPYNGDLTYWSERNSKLYDSLTAKALKKQHHSCGHCGLKLTSEQRVHLHHIDGQHSNWKLANLMAVHAHLSRLHTHEQKGIKP